MTKYSTEEEIWKDVKGYEGYYQVSNKGRVKSLNRISAQNHVMPEKILKQDVSVLGYCQVTFYKDGKKKREKVHRLAAFMFLTNENNYPQINHKDENPSNNNVDNLEWCTQAYNNLYNDRHKRIGKKMERAIYVIKDERKSLYDSGRKASKILGLTEASVYRCLRGELNTHKGYTFEYAK